MTLALGLIAFCGQAQQTPRAFMDALFDAFIEKNPEKIIPFYANSPDLYVIVEGIK